MCQQSPSREGRAERAGLRMRRIDVLAVVGVRVRLDAGPARAKCRLGVTVGRHDKQQACCIEHQQQSGGNFTEGDWHHFNLTYGRTRRNFRTCRPTPPSPPTFLHR